MHKGPVNRLFQLLTVQDVIDISRGNWTAVNGIYAEMAACVKDKLNGNTSPSSIQRYSEDCVVGLEVEVSAMPPQVGNSIKPGANINTPVLQYFTRLVKVLTSFFISDNLQEIVSLLLSGDSAQFSDRTRNIAAAATKELIAQLIPCFVDDIAGAARLVKAWVHRVCR